MSDTFVPAPAPANQTEPAGLDEAVGRIFGEAPALGAPDPYQDKKRVMQVFEDAKKQCLDGRWLFEKLWWRLLLYVLGRQWIYYDKKRGQWVDKRMADFMPRPVTNKCAESVDSLVSMFQAIRLQTTARPIGNASENVATAEVADAMEPHIADEHDMLEVQREADFWNTVTGNYFLHVYWDKDAEEGEVLVPFEKCGDCGKTSTPSEVKEAGGVCPKCGSANVTQTEGTDDETPEGEIVNTGRGKTEALSPFEVACPPHAKRFSDVDKLVRLRWRDKQWYEDNYPELAKKITYGKTPSERSLQFLRSLTTQADAPGSTLQNAGFGSSAEAQSEGVTEYELHMKPTREFPMGLWCRVAGEGQGGLLLESGPLPYTDRRGKPLWNWVHCGFITLAGRLWSRSPLELGLQKQDQINQLDSLIQLIIQRMGNPIWLKPKGAEVRSFTGAPGLVVEWNPLGASGAKPERLEGSNVQPSLFQLREQYLHDFEYLVGTFDVLKGAKPTGVEAFSTMQLLVERSQSRFTNVFKQRGKAYRRWYQIALELERFYGPTQRIIAVTKPNRGFTYRHFQKSDLQGAIQIIIEDGSQAPKTNLGRRAAIEQANQLRILNPQDPEQQYSILTGLGLNDLVPSLDFQVKSALNEQDAFEEWAEQMGPEMGQLQMLFAEHEANVAQLQAMAPPIPGMPPPPVPPPPQVSPFAHKPYHNPMIHKAEHVKWANSDRARELFLANPVLEKIFINHLNETDAAAMQEMMQQMGGPAQAPPPKKGGPMERSNAESGAPDTVPKGNSDQGPQNRGPE